MKIRVIGVGGCGSNTVKNVCNMGLQDVEFVIVTPSKESKGSLVSRPQECSRLHDDSLKHYIIDSDIDNWEDNLRPILNDCPEKIIVVAGTGGVYSAKVAAAILLLHKNIAGDNAHSIAFVTTPFAFERRGAKSAEDLETLGKQASKTVIFDNNQLRKMTDKSMNEAFATVDQKLAEIISESIHE